MYNVRNDWAIRFERTHGKRGFFQNKKSHFKLSSDYVIYRYKFKTFSL